MGICRYSNVASLVDFINRVRALQDLPENAWVEVARTEPDHDTNCILGKALGVPIISGKGDSYAMQCDDLGHLSAWWVPRGPDDTNFWPLIPEDSLIPRDSLYRNAQ